MSRPRIGITGVTRERQGMDITGVNAAYVRAVIAAGGLPVIITPELEPGCAVELFGECDGLLLTGGEDVDPARYGATPHEKLGAVSPSRDVNEIALIAEARARDLPILGICRGIQILNVACGGTLFQDLPSQHSRGVNHDPGGARDAVAHPLTLEPQSRLAKIFDQGGITANSIHHQGIDRLGEGLVATAHASDGLIEGIESSNPKEWLIGVQWHPEELAAAHAPQRRLFEGFMSAAGA